MPNIVTHTLVTARCFEGASPELLLGSTLPDFEGMNRDHLGGALRLADVELPEDLQRGVDFHHATDAAFDHHSDLRKLVVACMDDCLLNIPDLSQGAARAVASMGTDIMFDIPVLGSDHGRAVYEQVKTGVTTGEIALGGLSSEAQFNLLIREFFARDIALKYADMFDLATKMNYRFRLRRSGSLAFDEALVPSVAQALGRQLDRILDSFETILDATVEKLAA